MYKVSLIAVLTLVSPAVADWSAMATYPDGAKEAEAIHYYLFTPTLEEGKKYPVVLWLHGGVKSNGIGGPNLPADAFYKLKDQEKYPCFVLRPVAIKGTNWVSPRGPKAVVHKQPDEPALSARLVMKLLDDVIAKQPIDPKQVHVIGASMGGFGTWDLITRYPDRFATAIPICGGADPTTAVKLKSGPRIWAFHSADDNIVGVKGSRDMTTALFKARGVEPTKMEAGKAVILSSEDNSVRYTEFAGGGHDAWTRAMSDPALLEWMFLKK